MSSHRSRTTDQHRARPGGGVYTKAGACTHHSGAFLSLGTGKKGGGNPQGQGHICAHAYALSWQHPPWGEASTCPIPEQGAGVVARPQPGGPDSGERNEGGGNSCPGGLAQELEPSRPGPDPAPPPHLTTGQPGCQDSGCSKVLSLSPSVLVNKPGPSDRSRTQSMEILFS